MNPDVGTAPDHGFAVSRECTAYLTLLAARGFEGGVWRKKRVRGAGSPTAHGPSFSRAFPPEALPLIEAPLVCSFKSLPFVLFFSWFIVILVSAVTSSLYQHQHTNLVRSGLYTMASTVGQVSHPLPFSLLFFSPSYEFELTSIRPSLARYAPSDHPAT